MIPDSFLQELKLRVDIKDVISEYVKLKRSGRNWIGLCPFHNEKTPSFTVNTEKGFFHCFGCGVGGDAITFIRKIENLDYVSAVKLLAERAGMTLPEESFDDTESKLRIRILEANRIAAKFFYDNLYSPRCKKALDYLKNRQLTDKTITHYGLGYSLDYRFSLTNHLKNLGYSEEEIVAANLGFKSKNNTIVDRFYDRVMFPIIDVRGNVLGFGGRKLSDYGPKYLNTSDTVAFKKSYNLFSLNFAKNTNEEYFLLVEGYMDVIALYQAGFSNAIATLGTSLTQGQAKIISRYKNRVILSYDSDGAGQKATERAIPILRNEGLDVRVLNMGNQKDPDEYIKSYGKDGPARFKVLINNSVKDIDYKLNKLKMKFDLDKSDDKVQYLTQACKILSSLDNEIEKDVYTSKLAENLHVSKDAVFNQMRLLDKNNKDKTKHNIRKTNLVKRRGKITKDLNLNNSRSLNAEKALIAYFINSQKINDELIKKLSPERFSDDTLKKVYDKIIERFKKQKSFELTDLINGFSEDEISFLTDCISKSIYKYDNIENAKLYIDLINEEYKKKNIDLDSDMNDVESYLNKLKEHRK